jgi:hypothetical protein
MTNRHDNNRLILLVKNHTPVADPEARASLTF